MSVTAYPTIRKSESNISTLGDILDEHYFKPIGVSDCDNCGVMTSTFWTDDRYGNATIQCEYILYGPETPSPSDDEDDWDIPF